MLVVVAGTAIGTAVPEAGSNGASFFSIFFLQHEQQMTTVAISPASSRPPIMAKMIPTRLCSPRDMPKQVEEEVEEEEQPWVVSSAEMKLSL